MNVGGADILTDRDRLSLIEQAALVDQDPQPAFDRLVRLAARFIGAPIALVSIVTEDRQCFTAQDGLAEPLATDRQIPLSHSFCQHVVTSGEPLVVADAREHPDLKDNLAIPDLGVIAYAGMPLSVDGTGHTLGSFCVVDTEPRVWTDQELAVLRDLADVVMSEIEMRLRLRQISDLSREVEQLQSLLPMCAWCKRIRDEQDHWMSVEQYMELTRADDMTHGICPDCFAVQPGVGAPD